MQEPPRSGPVTVSVPARAEFVHVLRAVTASVAARLLIPYDGIEDLRLAVDEACAWLLGLGAEATEMTLHLEALEGRLEAVVGIVGVGGRLRHWPPESIEETFSWMVLSALVDSVSTDTGRTGPSIRLAKRTLETLPA